MKDAIFIVGVGRNGTSALARVLSLCGAVTAVGDREPLDPPETRHRHQ